MRRPPAALAGLVLLAAITTLIVAIILAVAGLTDQAVRVLLLTAVLLATGWLLAPQR
ncbi:MAG: hypothetical protein HY689_16160 [Chloroflexi bacterium]|nr:hypothetical protein [Chloroflexota bacterium]